MAILNILPFSCADIKRYDESFIIPEKYFVAVTCFLTFNVTAMLGNLLPNLFTWVSWKSILKKRKAGIMSYHV